MRHNVVEVEGLEMWWLQVVGSALEEAGMMEEVPVGVQPVVVEVLGY